MAGRVVVVGSVNIDLVVTVERLPGPGETVIGGRYERHHGGKGANAAVAAARLGADVSFIGAVGRDAFGFDAREALEAEGIDLAGLFTLDEPTGVALILVDQGGENSIAVAGGANSALDSVQVREALKKLALGPHDVVLVGHEIRTGATHEALRLGRLAGSTTILNPAPAAGLGRSTLDLADILTPNRGELETLAGPGKPAAVAKNLLGTGAKRAALVSLGSDGALLVRRSAVHGHQGPASRRGRCRGRGRRAERGAGRRARRGPGPGRRRAAGRHRRQPCGHTGRRPRGDAGRRRGGRRIARDRRRVTPALTGETRTRMDTASIRPERHSPSNRHAASIVPSPRAAMLAASTRSAREWARSVKDRTIPGGTR